MMQGVLLAVEKRRIEAIIVSQIYDEMVIALGEDKAKEILRNTITKVSVFEGVEYASQASVTCTPENYLELIQEWSTDGSMDITPTSVGPDHANFKVTRCEYAEMYHKIGLSDLGEILSCGRDGTVCSGYNPNIRLERPKTIMQGAAYCDFRLRLAQPD